MEVIILGTIGSGAIVHAVLDNVKIVEGIRLAAVYSRFAEKVKTLAAEYGSNRVYTEMDPFLADDEVNFACAGCISKE